MNIRCLFLLYLFLLFCPDAFSEQAYKVVGYYPAYNRSVFPPEKLDLSTLTHVNHAFAWPHPDGTIRGYDNIPDNGLVGAVHSAGKKVLIALGGYGNCASFPAVVADTNLRKGFIENIIAFLIMNRYDGVDVDWEWPSSVAQRDSLSFFIQALRRAFNDVDSTLLITMAVPVSNWSGQWLDFQKLQGFVDWFNAMTYDFHGGWTNHAGHNAPLVAPSSDYDGSVSEGLSYLSVTRSIAKSKILLGIPFYGRRFAASSIYGSSSGAEELTYTAIAEMMSTGWTRYWDALSKVPYLINSSQTAIITYDDSISVAEKCSYAIQNGYPGVMIWALGQDYRLQRQTLLNSIKNSLMTSSFVKRESAVKTQPINFLGIYPNPFNSSATIRYVAQTPMEITINICDLLGREIMVFDQGFCNPGVHSVRLDGTALAIPSGAYVCHLTGKTFSVTKRFLIIK